MDLGVLEGQTRGDYFLNSIFDPSVKQCTVQPPSSILAHFTKDFYVASANNQGPEDILALFFWKLSWRFSDSFFPQDLLIATYPDTCPCQVRTLSYTPSSPSWAPAPPRRAPPPSPSSGCWAPAPPGRTLASRCPGASTASPSQLQRLSLSS